LKISERMTWAYIKFTIKPFEPRQRLCGRMTLDDCYAAGYNHDVRPGDFVAKREKEGSTTTLQGIFINGRRPKSKKAIKEAPPTVVS
jgi:hypothetical protein